MLSKQATTKGTHKEEVKRVVHTAYVTSAGWLGYDDDNVRRLTLEVLHQGFNHFKMKVGSDVESDLRRWKVIRSVIDDPAGKGTPSPSSFEGENAGPMVLRSGPGPGDPVCRKFTDSIAVGRVSQPG